jgi:hypothetical protein
MSGRGRNFQHESVWTGFGAQIAFNSVGIRALSSGVNGQGPEADLLPPFFAEVKNMWIYIFTP